ncbi:MAG: NAD(P)H-binding protein, partial [Spirochaetes bacterium]|nr:NAD(P)H-binding protein [Spirochaetota bacterium]
MKVLLTGATGYIGRRLMARLIEDGDVDLRLFVRNIRKVSEETRERVEIVEGSSFDRESLRRALEGIDVAYYLIHSMGAEGDFRALDRLSAENFREACIDAGVKRVIYLGGLGRKECASKHLLSRIETGEVLSTRPGRIQTLWFRAGIIIGSGSASFEILWNYVEKTPFMILPRSVATRTQPIGIDDVLSYLSRARHLHVDGDLVIDIGSGVMSYRDIIKQTARVIGVKRRIVTIPLD